MGLKFIGSSSHNCSYVQASVAMSGGPVLLGIRTRGPVLKDLVQKSNATPKNFSGADKLDILVWLAEAVTKSIETGRKMDLSLKDLESFLASEGMEPTPGDAKKSAQLLLDLRLRELRRLSHQSKEAETAQEDASNFALVLVSKTDDEVKNCFAEVAVCE